MGSMINSGNHHYYYHESGWSDMNGVYHQAGYYSPEGYHYSSPQEFGYCPQFGEPGYVANCGTPSGGGSSQSALGSVIGVLVCCCCCCILIAFFFSNETNTGQKNERQPLVEDEEMDGDVTTFQGEDIPRADAVAFLQAVEAEFVDGVEQEVGNMYERRSILAEVQARLQCEEDRIRDSDDAEGAVKDLADRWGMRDMLNH